MPSETFDTIAAKLTTAELSLKAEDFFELSFSAEELAASDILPSRRLRLKQFAEEMYLRAEQLQEKSPPLVPAMLAA